MAERDLVADLQKAPDFGVGTTSCMYLCRNSRKIRSTSEVHIHIKICAYTHTNERRKKKRSNCTQKITNQELLLKIIKRENKKIAYTWIKSSISCHILDTFLQLCYSDRSTVSILTKNFHQIFRCNC